MFHLLLLSARKPHDPRHHPYLRVGIIKFVSLWVQTLAKVAATIHVRGIFHALLIRRECLRSWSVQEEVELLHPKFVFDRLTEKAIEANTLVMTYEFLFDF